MYMYYYVTGAASNSFFAISKRTVSPYVKRESHIVP
jgi:hypothetical protein